MDEPEAPDFDWVLPELAIGGRLGPRLAESLVDRFGIRRVVDLRAEEWDDLDLLARHGIALLHLPTPDLTPVPSGRLWEGVAWVGEGLARGERVLIHCEFGIGRSALLACCVLVSRGDSPLEALSRAKAARERVCPNPDQLHALLRWAADWHRERGTDCPADTWDELARVAYRHLGRLAEVDDR